MGRAEQALDGTGMHIVQDVWEAVAGPERAFSARVLCAVNRRYATYETKIQDGDEVAFFPPVTGG